MLCILDVCKLVATKFLLHILATDMELPSERRVVKIAAPMTKRVSWGSIIEAVIVIFFNL